VKLHVYAQDELERRTPDVLATFEKQTRANIGQVDEQWQNLSDGGWLRRGMYTGEVAVLHADVRSLDHWPRGVRADALMTSPPYGDNLTTVAYGQHSFLPLMWIDHKDLPVAREEVNRLLGSPYRIDVASLGGRRVRNDDDALKRLHERSPSLAKTARQLVNQPGDGHTRLIAFCADLASAIDVITLRLRPGALQFWTLGDRRISGLLVPTSRIVAELAAACGSNELTTLRRRIPRGSKRMAVRNSAVPTMCNEEVLVMQTAYAGSQITLEHMPTMQELTA
jgi:site-specific DNA-methyltransferase (cytosine-N4-specific)